MCQPDTFVVIREAACVLALLLSYVTQCTHWNCRVRTWQCCISTDGVVRDTLCLGIGVVCDRAQPVPWWGRLVQRPRSQPDDNLVTGIFPPRNAENVRMSWRHHVTKMSTLDKSSCFRLDYGSDKMKSVYSVEWHHLAVNDSLSTPIVIQ